MFGGRSQAGSGDRFPARVRNEVSLSSFAYLFSELVQYCQARVSNIGELERRLDIVGYGVGIRLLELGCFRDRAGRRDLHVLDALRFIHTPLWKSLFGHAARDLEQSNTADDEYMISDVDLFVTKYISVPKEFGHLNCAAFVAGIIRGALDGAGFAARVTAHNVAVPGQAQAKTTFLIKFDPAVLQREGRLPAS